LLDSELYLSESWAADRPRCRLAHIPEDVVYRPKWQIALELYDRARANGVSFAYLTFDEGYGGKPEFLRQLDAREQPYVAEIPRSFTGWLQVPPVTERPFRKGGRGRSRATPRLVSGSTPAHSVEYHLNWTEALKDQSWKRWRVKDTQKGPLVWETKHVLLTPKDEQGLPGKPLHLIVARNMRDPSEVKFFVSNAPAETPLEELLHVAFSRWRVERCFEDQKTELGFDHFEGRSYVGLKRHQAITAVTHLFLSEEHQRLRGKKSGVDRMPSADRRGSAGALMGAGTQGRQPDPRRRRRGTRIHPEAQRRGPALPHPNNSQETDRAGHPPHQPAPLRMEQQLAL
jgi:SRSO17 transposase